MVEDEDELRRLAVRELEERGYLVLAAANGVEAMAVARSLERPVDLLVTDVVMPEMNGVELAESLVELWPTVAVLFMSGHLDEGAMERHPLDPDADLLPKPFTPDQLGRRARHALDRAAANRRARVPKHLRAEATRSLTQGSKRYPTPRTVRTHRGLSGSTSILRRMRRMCSVTVPASCHSDEESHTWASSCSRVKTCRGEPARKASRANSLAVVSTRRSDTLISRAMVSMTRSPNSRVPFDEAELRRGAAAAQDRAHPGGQLGRGEGLHDVVVGAQLEAQHPVGLVALGRDQDDRARRWCGGWRPGRRSRPRW